MIDILHAGKVSAFYGIIGLSQDENVRGCR